MKRVTQERGSEEKRASEDRRRQETMDCVESEESEESRRVRAEERREARARRAQRARRARGAERVLTCQATAMGIARICASNAAASWCALRRVPPGAAASARQPSAGWWSTQPLRRAGMKMLGRASTRPRNTSQQHLS